MLHAATPDDALDIAPERQGGIDLRFTDVVMPGMDGAELQRGLLRIRPGIRTLFMSGYAADIIGECGILDGGIDFIQKPFSMRDLMKNVRELLD